MVAPDQPSDDPLPAGPFAPWLDGMQRALAGGQGTDVPCGTCTACCTSGQFVHIHPDEADTLAHIPHELLFPAPFLPTGHVLLGYDERGHCPMLADGKCSIYAYRPRTCRTYDCRVFPASGLTDRDKPPIAARAARWEFDVTGQDAERRLAAVQAAGAFLSEYPEVFPDGAPPPNRTQLAVLAVELHEEFLEASPSVDLIRTALLALQRRALSDLGC